MSKRINLMIDEDTWRILGRVSARLRSRVVNEVLRAVLPAANSADVARWIREYRDVQTHWSQRARERGVLNERQLHRYLTHKG